MPLGRSSGVLIPLFSIRSGKSFGVGELPDIADLAPWLERAHMKVLLMLPLVEAALGQDSPYSALSASAIDPVYVSLAEVVEFAELGGEAALSEDEHRELAELRGSRTVQYHRVRALKGRWLLRCYQHFRQGAGKGGERATQLARFREEQREWLPAYCLFRTLKDAHALDTWRRWEPPLRDRDGAALESARREHAEGCSFYEYVQWQAWTQLAQARSRARSHGVVLGGDLPFMVAEDSADVWERQDEFRLDATVGVPPDEFSKEGQDWGLPVYRWDVLASRAYDWLRLRGRRTAAAFDLVRVDHVVGFYRTYARPLDGSPNFFSPAVEAEQKRQGEAVMEALRSAGTMLVAEDLGVVPPWVRTSLGTLGIPGYKVLRWEKDGMAFRDPAAWPALSLATTGTHDTETMAEWWDALSLEERQAIRRIPALKRIRDDQSPHFCPPVHEALLEAVYGSGSDLLVLPIQDVFGHRERINLPASVGPDNWSYRMPWGVQQLLTDPEVGGRTEQMAALAARSGR